MEEEEDGGGAGGGGMGTLAVMRAPQKKWLVCATLLAARQLAKEGRRSAEGEDESRRAAPCARTAVPNH